MITNNLTALHKSFQLILEDGSIFNSEKIVRIIPGRRLVAFGVWQGKSVAAKLFFEPKHALRHFKQEIEGVKILQERKIPTPKLIYQGLTADSTAHVLLFDRIMEASNLDEIWQHKKNIEEILPLLERVIVELATQHVTGALQKDLHFKNFLVTEKLIYTLDGGQVEAFSHILTKKTSMDNLALFLSQLGVGLEKYQESLFEHYAKARGWRLKSQDMTDMFLFIRQWNDERWRKFEKKIIRNSTQFCKIKTQRISGVYERVYMGDEFNQFLADPEFVFRHPTMCLLKNGRSSTVVKVTLDSREFVIKRYNMKNIWHRLRRCLRSTRAFHSWRFAHKLKLFGIPTASPVAFIEYAILGLKGKSYYAMEYVNGEPAGTFFNETMIDNITVLLKNLRKLEMTHGDLKITNMLINKQSQPVLIDLDGAAEHRSVSSLKQAWQLDVKRFLENFRDSHAIRKKFEEALRF